MTIALSDYESGTPFDGDAKDTLKDLQERIAELLVSLHVHGRKAMIVVEGWDAAGKGGAIQRLTAQCDPRTYKVWPISAPTEDEKARHYLWRFWTKLPRSGEVAIFDRSYYGRVLVERVEGFATLAEWRRAYDEINEFEALQCADGMIIIKLFYHVTAKEQAARFKSRLDHPWKRWKVTAEDARNIAKRPQYLEAIADMFAATDTRWAPWTVIDGNDKDAARIATLQHVAERLASAVPKKPPAMSPEMEQLAQKILKRRD